MSYLTICKAKNKWIIILLICAEISRNGNEISNIYCICFVLENDRRSEQGGSITQVNYARHADGLLSLSAYKMPTWVRWEFAKLSSELIKYFRMVCESRTSYVKGLWKLPYSTSVLFMAAFIWITPWSSFPAVLPGSAIVHWRPHARTAFVQTKNWPYKRDVLTSKHFL